MSASRHVVFVLAMSRSGTSAITRILSLAGMSLPKNLMEPNVGNPTGYWESNEVVALNDAFLGIRRSNYYDPTLLVQSDYEAFESETARAFVATIAAFIESHGDDSPLLIKDPRLVALAPYWFRGAAHAGRIVRCILPVRDPRAVISSLSVRDGASYDFSNILWLKYTLLAERVSRRFPRVFVDYSTMITHWREQVRRIERELELAMKGRMKRAVRAFVDPQLDTSGRRSTDDTFEPVPLTEIVYDQVSRAATGERIDMGVMDRAFAAFRRRDEEIAKRYLRAQDAAFYLPGNEIAKWDRLGVRFARALSKGPPFPSA